MDADDLRRHLTDGAGSTTGRGGPADMATTMNALSVVSTDLGQLKQIVEDLTADVTALEAATAKHEALAQGVAKLAERVTALGEAIESSGEEAEPPPQPWDWAGMGWQEELAALATLAEWVETHLIRWWPRVIAKGVLPPCWVDHPDMRRDLSLLYVSYQQAYEHPGRRVHHESDFRRTLDDMLRDITAAADEYGCHAQKEGQSHVTHHVVRSDRAQVRHHVQVAVIARIQQAEQAGKEDEAAQLMDQYKITPQVMREHMNEAFNQAMALVRTPFAPKASLTAAAREAGRLLISYQLVDRHDLSQALLLKDLMEVLHEIKDPLFQEMVPTYEPLLRKFSTISEHLDDLLAGRIDPALSQAVTDHRITQQDVYLVNELLR